MAKKSKQTNKPEKKFLTDPDYVITLDDLQYEELHLPEWDRWVMVKEMTAAERDLFDIKAQQMQAKARSSPGYNFELEIRAMVAVMCVVHHETKDRLFSDQQIHVLTHKSARPLDAIYETVTRMSLIGIPQIKRIAENLAKTQANGSKGA